MEKTAILQQFDFFAQVNRKQREALLGSAMLARLATGDYYFHEGDVCSQIALVGQGDIRVFKTGESGREITLYHVGPGETCILTASCVLAGKQYPAHACAECDSTAIVFPAQAFRSWIATCEALRQFVFETLARRMADVMSLIEEITFNKMDRRLASYLLRRFENEGKPLRIIHDTHEHIAAELGSAREVVSRLLKELERLRAIELARGRIILKDAAKLKALT